MQALTAVLDHYNYAVTIFLMMAGLYIVVARSNLVKKLVGLSMPPPRFPPSVEFRS